MPFNKQTTIRPMGCVSYTKKINQKISPFTQIFRFPDVKMKQIILTFKARLALTCTKDQFVLNKLMIQ